MDVMEAATTSKVKLAQIRACFENACAIWDTIDRDAQSAMIEFHNGTGTLAHCILLGLQASKELQNAAKQAPTIAVIDAECHSDDRVFEVPFNAVKWFENASDDAIRNLAVIGWGGGEGADRVAEFAEQENAGIREMQSYLRRIAGTSLTCFSGKECGFECHVNEDHALAWLRTNRPELHAELAGMTDAPAVMPQN